MDLENIEIIPIEEDLETQKRAGITAEDLQNKRYWELAVDAGLIKN